MDKVCKPFNLNGKERETGEVLDADNFRNLQKLREYRYLSPFEGEYVECDVCNRKFADDKSLEKHLEQEHENIVQVDYSDEEIENILDDMHTGRGWYEVIEGESKIQGREDARDRLLEALENNEEVA